MVLKEIIKHRLKLLEGWADNFDNSEKKSRLCEYIKRPQFHPGRFFSGMGLINPYQWTTSLSSAEAGTTILFNQ
jgi:hypothetical protein